MIELAAICIQAGCASRHDEQHILSRLISAGRNAGEQACESLAGVHRIKKQRLFGRQKANCCLHVVSRHSICGTSLRPVNIDVLTRQGAGQAEKLDGSIGKLERTVLAPRPIT